jgi:lipooligosaccharide transport system permease protein
MNELLQTFRLSWYVVIRNWIVYRKDFLANISPTLTDPALTLGVLGLGLSPFLSHIGGLTYAQYLAPGMAAMTVMFTAFFESSYGFYIRMTMEYVFKAMLTTPIGVNEVVWGEYIWVAIRAAGMATGVGVVVAVFGLLPNLWALLWFPLIAALMSVPCTSMGLLSCTYIRNISQLQTVYSFLIAPLHFISGIYFPVNYQSALGLIVQLSPVYHGVMLLQMTAWNRFNLTQVLYHVAVLMLFSVITLLWSRNRVWKKLVS